MSRRRRAWVGSRPRIGTGAQRGLSGFDTGGRIRVCGTTERGRCTRVAGSLNLRGGTARKLADDPSLRFNVAMSQLIVRDATVADYPFLEDMLYEASFAMDEPKPPRDAIQQPQIFRYISGWGRSGDRALVADVAGQRVGAAWYRLFPISDPGYGFVDEATPELSIAVTPGQRGRGVGRALLERLLDEAQADGFDALSLSVARSNAPARGLYERCGFQVVAVDEAEDGVTMRAPLPPR